jgi:flagellar L-ring protein precursor FlgH
VGDILKVRLDEKTQGSKKSTTDNSKTTTVTTPVPVLFGRSVPWLEQTVNSGSTFKGSGDSDQSNSLTGDISVTVYKVLGNGNLAIRGEKWIKINTGREYIRLSGLVRPVDIEPDNSISSIKVADPRIEYSATGQLADANKEGWLGQFFNSPIWPF